MAASSRSYQESAKEILRSKENGGADSAAPNPFIERTNSGRLRPPPFAAQVER